jgi:hypothetical protein
VSADPERAFNEAYGRLRRERDELRGRVAELATVVDDLKRKELKADPKWVELRTLESGAVCDGQCSGESDEVCGTCRADAQWKARIEELETAANLRVFPESRPTSGDTDSTGRVLVLAWGSNNRARWTFIPPDMLENGDVWHPMPPTPEAPR